MASYNSIGEPRNRLPTPPSSVTSDKSASRSALLGKHWWNVNLPAAEWTSECPDYLESQVEKNVKIMSIKDQDHPRLSWKEVVGLIGGFDLKTRLRPHHCHVSGRTRKADVNTDSGCIDQFHRMPTDLRRYIKYCHDLKQRYGSVLYFMQHERLKWPAIDPSGDAPFSNSADFRILMNDWPYSIDLGIVHIVVWTKFHLADDPQTGELTEENKAVVEEFVLRTFCSDAAGNDVVHRDHLRWFKNSTALRSIHALGELAFLLLRAELSSVEHIHIMLYHPSPEFVHRITNGDKAMCEQF